MDFQDIKDATDSLDTLVYHAANLDGVDQKELREVVSEYSAKLLAHLFDLIDSSIPDEGPEESEEAEG